MARRKSDAERGPFGAWAYNTRDALGLSVEQVIPLLPTTYHPATLRKAEGGTVPPGSRMWRELGNLYGQLADEKHVPLDAQPRLASEATAVEPTPDPLIAALTAQTAAIAALVGELQQWRSEDRDRLAATERVVERLAGSLLPGSADGASPRRPARRQSAR